MICQFVSNLPRRYSRSFVLHRLSFSLPVDCIEDLITVAEVFIAYYTLAVVCNIIESVLLGGFSRSTSLLSFGHGTALCYSEPIRTAIVRGEVFLLLSIFSKEWEMAPCLTRRVLSVRLTMNF